MTKHKRESTGRGETLVSLPMTELQPLQEMLDTVDKTIDALSESADDSLRKLRKQLRRGAKRTRGTLKQLNLDPGAAESHLRTAKGYMRSHPWRVAGLLATAGALTVLALSRGRPHAP